MERFMKIPLHFHLKMLHITFPIFKKLFYNLISIVSAVILYFTVKEVHLCSV